MRVVGDAFKQAKNAPVITPVFLYSILVDPVTNTFKRFTNHPGGVTFDGEAFQHFAVSHTALSEDGTGQIQKAQLIISNVSREIQAIIDANDGLRNRQVTITQVWLDFLADTTAFISDVMSISDTVVTERQATFSLASTLDVLDIRLPRRSITRTFCRFRFKSPECGFVGAETTCDKTLNRCRELGISRRFGGFPATPLQKQFLEEERG